MELKSLKENFLGYEKGSIVIPDESNFFGIIYDANDKNLGYYISTSKPELENTGICIAVDDIVSIYKLVVNGAEIPVKIFEKTFLKNNS